MEKYSAYADRDIAGRERLEDACEVALLTTAGGLELQVGIVCDGVGGHDSGEVASYVAIQTILRVMRTSRERHIPKLLSDAIIEANDAIRYRFEGKASNQRGSTTVAMYAIDTSDGDWGRLFIASVGDSRIYLLRPADDDDPVYEAGQMRLIRLNTDHTRANDMVMSGQITPDRADFVEGGHKLTRALGHWERIEVDTGIYAMKDRDFVPRRIAEKLGATGLLLKEADTIFSSSDGFFDLDPDTGDTYVTESEFVRHARDTDVTKAARTLIAYGTARSPRDNVSIAMTFVAPESALRKEVRVRGEIPLAVRVGAGIFVGVTVIAIALLLAFLGASGSENAELRQTQEAVALQDTAVANQTATAEQFTATPTSTVTPTSTPTRTPTLAPTATPRPILNLGDVGFFVVADDRTGFQEGSAIEAEQLSHASLTGQDQDIAEPSTILLYPDSRVIFDRVSDQRQEIEIENDSPSSQFFLSLGQFAVGGLELRVSFDTSITANTPCIALQHITEDEVAVTCIGETDACTLDYRGTSQSLSSNQQYQFDLSTGFFTEQFDLDDGDPLTEIEQYYTDATSLIGESAATCLLPIVDADLDTFLASIDACPTLPGIDGYTGRFVNFIGCPDSDADAVPDVEEPPRCVGVRGLPAFNGCLPPPTATNTPLPPDSDGDGIPDFQDNCPFDVGPADNGGCPRPTGSQ